MGISRTLDDAHHVSQWLLAIGQNKAPSHQGLYLRHKMRRREKLGLVPLRVQYLNSLRAMDTG